MMDTVSCSCAKCGTFISDFDNAWNKFGKGHYMPILTGSKSSNWSAGLQPSQDARMAALNTVLEDSYLQDLVCKGCGEVLGLKCQNAPQGHILKKDQILLRLKKLNVLSRRTGNVAQPVVRKSHELNKEAGGQTAEIKDGLDAENEDTRHFREWAEESIREQKADIDRISSSMQRVESDMQSFKDFMVVVRKELSNRPTHTELDAARVSITESIDRRQGATLSQEDLDLMTDSFSKISSRVSEVDTLKLELQLLKSRIKRFEENDARDSSMMRSEPQPLSVQPVIRQLQRVANSTGNKRPRIDDTHDLTGLTSAKSNDEYTEGRKSRIRSRSASSQKDGDEELEKPRRYRYRKTEKKFGANGFPLTANGKIDRRFKTGNFAGKRLTSEKRSLEGGRKEARNGRSTSRGEMTRSEEREEQRLDREQRREEGDNTDDYEEEAEIMNHNGDVERGRREGRNEAEKNESEYPDPEADDEKRKEALEKRERLVVREMSMNF